MSLKSRIEALIYAAEEPVTLAQLSTLLAHEVSPQLAVVAKPEDEPAEEAPSEEDMESSTPLLDGTGAEKKAAKEQERKVREVVRAQVLELIADYANNERGMEIREVAGGYRMSTKPEYHDTVRSLVKSLKPALKLSLQALETLAVIAYKQPVTAPEISEIRGVDSGGVLGSLVARKLITTAGRKQVIGRPILYKTTREFLLRFGLKDISELPSIEEFEKLAGELTELEEQEAEMQESTETIEPGGAVDAAAEDAEPEDAAPEEVQASE